MELSPRRAIESSVPALDILTAFLPKDTSGSAQSHGSDQVQAGFLLLACVLSSTMFLYRLWDDGLAAATLFTLFACLSYIALLFGFRHNLDRGLVADLSLLLLLLAISGVASHDHGLYSRVMIWLPAVPLIGNFFAGRIRAVTACILVVLLLSILVLAHKQGWLVSHPDLGSEWARFAAFSGSTMLVSATAFLYERNRRQADAEKARLAQLHRQWVAVVSHELRTPLTALRGALALGSRLGERQDETRQPMFEIALRNADRLVRLVRLVDDLLDMERINSGNLTPIKVVTDINAMLNNAAATYEFAASDRQMNIAVESSVTTPVYLDPDRIEQVIHNFLSNAIKFSPEASTIRLRATLNEPHLRIEVIDAGAGIAPEFAARLFQPFSQGDGNDDRQHGGFGLGLSICKAIINAHGGRIGYRNHIDGGCSFYFELPAQVASNLSSPN